MLISVSITVYLVITLTFDDHQPSTLEAIALSFDNLLRPLKAPAYYAKQHLAKGWKAVTLGTELPPLQPHGLAWAPSTQISPSTERCKILKPHAGQDRNQQNLMRWRLDPSPVGDIQLPRPRQPTTPTEIPDKLILTGQEID